MNNTTLSIPKNMRKVEEEKYGLSFKRISLIIGYLLITTVIIIIVIISKSIISQAFYLGILFLIWGLYIIKLRTSEMLDNTFLFSKFMIKKIKKMTVIAKYDKKMNIGFMEQIVPLRSVHENGLLEFIDNRYAVLLKVDTPRISDDDLQQHVYRIAEIINALHGNIMLKIFVFSRSSSFKPLENILIKCMRYPTKSDKQIKHLYELNKHIRENKKVPISWQTLILIGLGTHPNLEEAEIARLAHIPGLSSRFNKAGLHIIQMISSQEIVMAYRQAMTQISL